VALPKFKATCQLLAGSSPPLATVMLAEYVWLELLVMVIEAVKPPVLTASEV
jgi:hypothetical protein